MDVAGHDDFLPRFYRSHDHRFDAGTRPADHQKGVRGTESVGRQFLRFTDDRNGVTEIVQSLHRIHIRTDAVAPEEIPERLISPPALMSGHVKMNHAGIAYLFNSIAYRYFCLI